MALDPTINLTAAYRGSAGTTAIEGATRARLRPNMVKKIARSGGSELPDRVWLVGARPQVIIETEDGAAFLSGLTGAGTVEIVKAHYKAASANKVFTVGGAVLADVGELPIDPREQGGNVSRMGLTFNVVKNGTNDTLVELLTIA